MRAAALLVPLVVAAGALAPAAAADAAPRATAPSPVTGYDVSYPQRDAPLPASGSLAIVGLTSGINDGSTATTNPDLQRQLAWAARSPHREVYLNTQHPDPAEAAWWPVGDTARHAGHVAVPSAYGHCTGAKGRLADSAACSYVYGWSVAADDLTTYGAALRTAEPARWWLDVESANDWTGSASVHRAVLEGMAARLTAASAAVGLYAVASEFQDLVGTVPSTSPLHALPTWLAIGSTTEASAERLCTHAALAGGRVLLAQWRVPGDGAFDQDLTCSTFATAPSPKVTASKTVGHVAKAAVGTWSPKPSFAYRWTRDGRTIAKATGSTYRIVGADSGHDLRVVVTATAPGYDRTVRTSPAVRVHR